MDFYINKTRIGKAPHEDTDQPSDGLAIPEDDLDKSLTTIIDSIPLNTQTNLELQPNGIRKIEQDVFHAFIGSLFYKLADNPDWDGIDPDTKQIKVPYIPTLREFVIAMTDRLGRAYVLRSEVDFTNETTIAATANVATKMRLSALPRLEDSADTVMNIKERALIALLMFLYPYRVIRDYKSNAKTKYLFPWPKDEMTV